MVSSEPCIDKPDIEGSEGRTIFAFFGPDRGAICLAYEGSPAGLKILVGATPGRLAARLQRLT